MAGKIRFFADKWMNLTSDPFILDTVKHSHIDFMGEIKPKQYWEPKPYDFDAVEKCTVNNEIHKLMDKGVIEVCQPCENQYVSNIFLRSKKDGSYRTILNLSRLNQSVEYQKFKMETLESIIKLVRPGCFMASLDLKDAYYSVPIAVEDRVFLRFWWENTLYQYTCFPNGLTSAPRKFTKLMKPVLAHLRLRGYTNAIYIDDLYLQAESESECSENVIATENCITGLGFTINEKKSVKTPSQQLVMLGFILDSSEMSVRLTTEKAAGVKTLCMQMRQRKRTSVQRLAELIGKLCSSFPGAEHGQLYYRSLEKLKCLGLKLNRGDFAGTVMLNETVYTELDWWIDNIEYVSRPISHGDPSVYLETDASKTGWGATVKGGTPTGGRWDPEEAKLHINVLEITASFFGLKCFCSDLRDTHVRLFIDNTTTVSYINAMGGTKSNLCDEVAKKIWQWCQARNIWVSACHIPGKLNVEADKASRQFNDRTEWMLDKAVFSKITTVFFLPDIDLFASRINRQLPRYGAWHADPEAELVDAFMSNWGDKLIYLFPPFSLIGNCLQKMSLEKVDDALLVAPLWPTQPWFTQLAEMLVDHPRLLPSNILTLPGVRKETTKPLKVQLVVCHCSGSPSRSKTFREMLPPSSWDLGHQAQGNSTTECFKNGKYFVVKKKLMCFKPL